MTQEQLEAMGLWPAEESAEKGASNGVKPKAAQNGKRGKAPFDGVAYLEQFIETHAIEVKWRGPYENGERFVLPVCPFDSTHAGSRDAAVFGGPDKLGFKCYHNGCADNHWKEFKALFVTESAQNGKASHAAPEPSDDEINVTELDLPALTAQAIAALDRWNNPARLFVRDGDLVRVDVHPKTGQPRVRPVTVAMLRKAMADSAAYVRYKPTRDGAERISVSPPRDLVETVGASERFPFPILRGIARAPFFTVGWKMVVAHGYDPDSAFFLALDAGLVIPGVSLTPTKEEIEAALELIEDCVFDFPFDSDASKAHFRAAMFLPFVITAIPGPTPLHTFGAPVARSGKTLLATISAIPAVGQIAADSFPRSSSKSFEPDAEVRKKIISILQAQQVVQLFDNIDGPVDSSALNIALTNRLVKGRLLSTNDSPDFENNVTWLATANNAQFSGELRDRSISCRIDAGMERPNTRTTFKHSNPVKYALDHRGALIGAVLTIIQAWVAAGRPKPETTPPAFGSYEAWSETIGGILANAGIRSFLENRDDFEEQAASDDDQSIREFVLRWANRIDHIPCQDGTVIHLPIPPITRVKAAALVPLAVELMIVDSATSEKSQDTKIGSLLRRYRDNVFGQYRISQDVATRTWYLKTIERKNATSATSGNPENDRSQPNDPDEQRVSATSATSATSEQYTEPTRAHTHQQTRAHAPGSAHAHARMGESDITRGRRGHEVAESTNIDSSEEPSDDDFNGMYF